MRSKLVMHSVVSVHVCMYVCTVYVAKKSNLNTSKVVFYVCVFLDQFWKYCITVCHAS